MPTLITDPDLESRLKAEREVSGADRFDEVWEGIYMIAPIADYEHQQIQSKLAFAIRAAIGFDHPADVLSGVNVSDREEDWTHNYRVPDVAVYFPDNPALRREAHTVGGPDFAVEIVSAHDRSREKRDFYAAVSVRELLLVDRGPWSLELYRLDLATRSLSIVARSTPDHRRDLRSRVLPLSFTLTPATPRPTILVTQHDAPARWNI